MRLALDLGRMWRFKTLDRAMDLFMPGPVLYLGTTYHDFFEHKEKRREETKDVFIAPKMRPNFGCITGHLGVGVF